MCDMKVFVSVLCCFMLVCGTAANQNGSLEEELSSANSCGSTEKMVDDCFKDLPPHLMEFLQNTKIVITKQEIIAKCK